MSTWWARGSERVSAVSTFWGTDERITVTVYSLSFMNREGGGGGGEGGREKGGDDCFFPL